MRIAIIGGGAFSTPHLIHYLDKHKLPGRLEIVLAGRSLKKLDAVKRASSLLGSGAIDIRVERIAPETWNRVLDGAECVLIQARVGGYEGRGFDETFPHKYGLCGDEGLGASGLSVGWRTWPVLAETIEAIVKFCPRAFVILMTSPLSLLVRASYKFSSLRLVGVCELPWTTLHRLNLLVGNSADCFTADYLGVNHLGWFFNFQDSSGDAQGKIVAALGQAPFPDGSFLRRHKCFPTRYLQMHYEPARALAEQLVQKMPRAETLAKLQENAFSAYSDGSVTDVAEALRARCAPWYSQAVGPLILALNDQPTDIPFFLSVPHDSYTDVFQSDDIVECAHRWIDKELVRVPLNMTPPEHLVENLTPFVLFERIAVEAIMNRSLSLLKEALAVHPWTRGHPQVESIANEIVSYNESMMTVAHGALP